LLSKHELGREEQIVALLADERGSGFTAIGVHKRGHHCSHVVLDVCSVGLGVGGHHVDVKAFAESLLEVLLGSPRHKNLHPTGQLLQARLKYEEQIIIIRIRSIAALIKRVDQDAEATPTCAVPSLLLAGDERIYKKAVPKLDRVEMRIGQQFSKLAESRGLIQGHLEVGQPHAELIDY